MVDLNFILGILDDYCELQTSGVVGPANRYSVSDVREQIEGLESFDTASAELIACSDELKLARTVLSHRAEITRLKGEKEALELRVSQIENGVLAQRVAELDRQLTGMSKLVDDLQDQRDAEAALVEKLKKDITTALRGTKVDHAVRDGDGLVPFGKTEMAISVLTASLCNFNDEAAMKYLAERDAKIARKGYVAGAVAFGAVGMAAIVEQEADEFIKGQFKGVS